MNKTFGLYLSGFVVVIIAIAVPPLAWLSPVTFLLIFPLAAIWLWKSEGRALGDLGNRFSQGWLRRLAIGLVVGLAIPILFQVIQSLGRWITLSPRGLTLTEFPIYLLQVFLKMVFVVGLEELVSRGFFLQAWGQRVDVRFAAVLSSLLWGAAHLTSMVTEGLTPEQMLIGMITFLLWGITLCISFWQSGKSLWLPYGLHLGINLGFSLVGWFFVTQPNAPEWWLGHPAWSPESGLIGVVGWLVIAVVIYGAGGLKQPTRSREASQDRIGLM